MRNPDQFRPYIKSADRDSSDASNTASDANPADSLALQSLQLTQWPDVWPVSIGAPQPTMLPLVRSSEGFGIYSLDLMGQVYLTSQVALALHEKLQSYNFDIILAAEAKAIALAHALAGLLGHPEFVVLRKSQKL